MKAPLTKTGMLGYLGAIFVVGAVAGWLGGYCAGSRKAMLPPHDGMVTNRMAAYLKSKLHVTDKQLEQMQPILAETACEFEAIRTNSADHVNQVFERANQRIAPFLDAEQKGLLEDLERQRQEQFKKFLKPDGVKSSDKN